MSIAATRGSSPQDPKATFDGQTCVQEPFAEVVELLGENVSTHFPVELGANVHVGQVDDIGTRIILATACCNIRTNRIPMTFLG